jgi:hypothetical protein
VSWYSDTVDIFGAAGDQSVDLDGLLLRTTGEAYLSTHQHHPDVVCEDLRNFRMKFRPPTRAVNLLKLAAG